VSRVAGNYPVAWKGYDEVAQFGLLHRLGEEGVRSQGVSLLNAASVIELAQNNPESLFKGFASLEKLEDFKARHSRKLEVEHDH